MNRNQRTICNLALFAFVVMASAVVADEREDQERLSAENKQALMRQTLQSRDLPITFHGKIVDQSGQPVEDAEITVHVVQYSPSAEDLFGRVKVISTKSKRDGSFLIAGEHGREAYVHAVTKTGYASLSVLDRQLLFSPAPNAPVGMPTAAHPATFVVRKIGDAVPMLKGAGRLDLSANSSNVITRLLRPTEDEMDLLGAAVASAGPGLRSAATLSPDPAVWVIRISGEGEADSILLAAESLYEAPTDGYRAQVTLTVSADAPYRATNAVLCLKTSSPETYSLVRLSVRPSNGKCTVHFESMTNPYGTRTLENVEELDPYWGRKKQLEIDAKKALSQSRHPERPDVQKIVAEEAAKKGP